MEKEPTQTHGMNGLVISAHEIDKWIQAEILSRNLTFRLTGQLMRRLASSSIPLVTVNSGLCKHL